MRKSFCLLLLNSMVLLSIAQPQPAVIDSLKIKLEKATTDKERFELTAQLSKIMMNVNPAMADEFGQQLIEIAETSRDRQLMINALLINGERYSYLAGRRDNIDKSMGFYNRALNLARENKIDSMIVKAYLSLSEISRYIPDYDKALNYCNQANSYNVILSNDSIAARVHLEYGSVYIGKDEKLLALRSFFAAVRIAEDLKNTSLLRSGYNKLSGFYAVIEDYDRSIDFQVKSIQLIDKLHTAQGPYLKVQELNRVGDLHAFKKNYEMASFYYEKSLKLADSLKYEPIKAMSYRSIVNNYLSSGQPRKALDYFNEHPQLKDFLQRVNFGHFVDQSYGYIYTMLGKYDSAKFYYNRVSAFFEKDVNVNNQFGYYYQLGMLYAKTGEVDKSLEYYLKAKRIADQIGSLDQMRNVATMLDSVYQQKGDYKQAMYFASLNTKYKDSLDKLGEEKDLMQIEAADEQQRQERALKEKLEKDRRRNNIQYMMITFGIIGLFIALVVLGMFKVSATTIKMIGFFAFLMFFEFIFLIFKKNIYSITKGEPWKDLLFMISLAALLLPLHHWIEHRVIKYLTSHNRLTSAGHHLKNRFLRRRNQGNV